MTALYEAEVGHVRHERMHRAFTHGVYMWLVDVDALPRLPWWLRPFATFRADDHLGSPELSIRSNVDNWLRRHDIDLRGGRVLMLAHARVLGYVFNPITLFWCHRPDGELACVIAEVHNTYHERHCYLLHPDANGKAVVPKDFYVSPFLTLDGDYVMRVPRPDERLAISVVLRQHGTTPLVATLRGTRRPATTATILRTVAARPLMPQRVSALIRGHGVALWARGVPTVPRRPHEEGVR